MKAFIIFLALLVSSSIFPVMAGPLSEGIGAGIALGNAIRSNAEARERNNNPPVSHHAGPPKLYSPDGTYLGTLSSNQADPESISNEAGKYGSSASPYSIHNKAGKYGSSASPYSPNNPAASGANTPRIYGSDGKYLGNLSSNSSDPNSVSNPAGRYGSPASPDSINNPSGRYGSSSSPDSVNNPAAVGGYGSNFNY